MAFACECLLATLGSLRTYFYDLLDACDGVFKTFSAQRGQS